MRLFVCVCVFSPGWRVPFWKTSGRKTNNLITTALFNVFTEHVPVHMQDRNIKGDHFHLEGIGAPQLLREFINLYR